MLSINASELIWTIINFFLLFFVLKHFLFDPLLKTYTYFLHLPEHHLCTVIFCDIHPVLKAYAYLC